MITQETAAAGTSLEVLRHYLAADIEIEFMLIKRRRVLKASELHETALLIEGGHLWPFSECLPVLRSFSQLCEPLPDGTVPAIEIAKILLVHQHDVEHHRYDAAGVRAKQSKAGAKWVEVSTPGLNDTLEVAIYSNYDLENEDRGVDTADVLAVVEYLRRNHFAVGLEPHQYVEKTPALSTIEKQPAL